MYGLNVRRGSADEADTEIRVSLIEDTLGLGDREKPAARLERSVESSRLNPAVSRGVTSIFDANVN